MLIAPEVAKLSTFRAGPDRIFEIDGAFEYKKYDVYYMFYGTPKSEDQYKLDAWEPLLDVLNIQQVCNRSSITNGNMTCTDIILVQYSKSWQRKYLIDPQTIRDAYIDIVNWRDGYYEVEYRSFASVMEFPVYIKARWPEWLKTPDDATHRAHLMIKELQLLPVPKIKMRRLRETWET